jgi:hypothetical protein
MSSTIFFGKIYWLFIISIFIPSHQYSVFIEGKSLELALFDDIDGTFCFIEGFSDIFSFFRDRYDRSIHEDQIFISST